MRKECDACTDRTFEWLNLPRGKSHVRIERNAKSSSCLRQLALALKK